MFDVSIIIPTYNEATNIEPLIKELTRLGQDYEIIIVDDDSPDGTGKIAENLKSSYPHLKVIHRKDRGLASAVVIGFQAAEGNIIGVMDADFSHPIETILKLTKPLREETAEIVIGSRYLEGGSIVGWNLLRKITSRGAILLARPLTPIRDSVSGFFFMKKTVIEGVYLNPKGYKIGLEVIVKGRYSKAEEVPYIFTNRKEGKSKLNFSEYINYLMHLLMLYSYKIKRIM
jgi:dolichol-phosphate mannosyltransferase